MKFGLEQKLIDQINNLFSQIKEIEQVIIYGSRAKGNFRKRPDIDLTLMGNGISTQTILKIQNQIDDLLSPYQFDISIYNQISNQELKEHIKRIGIVFYQKE